MEQFPLSKKITFIMTVVGFAMVIFGLVVYATDKDRGISSMDIGAVLLALSMIIDFTALKNWIDEQNN